MIESLQVTVHPADVSSESVPEIAALSAGSSIVNVPLTAVTAPPASSIVSDPAAVNVPGYGPPRNVTPEGTLNVTTPPVPGIQPE